MNRAYARISLGALVWLSQLPCRFIITISAIFQCILAFLLFMMLHLSLARGQGPVPARHPLRASPLERSGGPGSPGWDRLL